MVAEDTSREAPATAPREMEFHDENGTQLKGLPQEERPLEELPVYQEPSYQEQEPQEQYQEHKEQHQEQQQTQYPEKHQAQNPEQHQGQFHPPLQDQEQQHPEQPPQELQRDEHSYQDQQHHEQQYQPQQPQQQQQQQQQQPYQHLNESIDDDHHARELNPAAQDTTEHYPAAPNATQPPAYPAEQQPAIQHPQPTQQHPLYSTGDYPEGPQADSSYSSSSDDGDSALGSFRSTQTGSLTSSVFAYRYENGRRYHAARGSAEYALPNDEKEMDRLDLQHHLCKLTLSGALHRAPLQADYLQKVLDLGTGTGIWAIDFAEQYPAAQVVGVDLSPIQPDVVPPNCQFYVDDFETEWMFDREEFDYVHSRMLIAACKDWRRLFAQAHRALKPGGWVEAQDFCFPARCDDGSAPPGSPLMYWSNLVVEGAKKVGVHLDITPQLPQMMRDAGFVDVHVEWYAWPTNRWPKDPKLKEIGTWANLDMQEGLESICLNIFTKVLGWQKEEVDILLAKVRTQLHDRKAHAYAPIGVFYGRKPRNDEITPCFD